MQRSPFAVRQGVFRSIIGVALVASAFAAAPAHAATVPVTFGISAVTYAPTAALCELSVPAGADGLVVLDAAVDAGCITSYHAQGPTQFGYFVDCINEICGETATGMYLTYWGMYENGVTTTYGVSDFRAAAGDELTFAYTTWAGCVAPTGCLP
jgi:hypothetical protein